MARFFNSVAPPKGERRRDAVEESCHAWTGRRRCIRRIAQTQARRGLRSRGLCRRPDDARNVAERTPQRDLRAKCLARLYQSSPREDFKTQRYRLRYVSDILV